MTVDEVLADATFTSDDRPYRLIKLPPNAIIAGASIAAEVGEAFVTMIADKDEVTLVIPAELVSEFERRLQGATVSDHAYRLITLDVELDPDLVGLMARISTALADQGVSLLPLAAFSRDHFLVSESQFETALSTLERL